MKRGIATLFASGVLLVALTGAAIAGPLDDAIAALQRGDYTMAMRLIRPLAEQGNAGAQTDLGVIYDSGLGVPQDLRRKGDASVRSARHQFFPSAYQFRAGVIAMR